MKTENKKSGFSLLELLIVISILTFMIAGVFMTLNAGQSAWSESDAQGELQEQLRRTMQRVSMELRQSGSYVDTSVTCPPGVPTITTYVNIDNNTGSFGSDVLRFSIPVVCEAGGDLMDVNGDVAYWRAPLTWGCAVSDCMDADDSCATVDYSEVEYRLNSNNQLVRRVLNGAGAVVRTDIAAINIADFQAELAVPASACVPSTNVTLTVTAAGTSYMNRDYTVTNTQEVRLRNGG